MTLQEVINLVMHRKAEELEHLKFSEIMDLTFFVVSGLSTSNVLFDGCILKSSYLYTLNLKLVISFLISTRLNQETFNIVSKYRVLF